MHQVDVMAADVRERIGVLRRQPVLEIRMAIIPLLHQARGAEFELAEHACAVSLARHQTAIIEAFVVFDADNQITLARSLLNRDPTRLAVNTSGLTHRTCWPCSRAVITAS